ncbi:RNA polymerase sigma factor [Mesorhizobium sp. 113-3-9]|uniref:sigma-70 family RNA polymerase sigma factor n=1 Tax=Mesorhizobium sp. 113-3-9 TaxID=2744517 RepID=UPI0019281E7C|nr:sigma-70 family RNA polymerase sigma factor [Mesorhizobium sp. 113-3-9]BCG86574.1 RNA polymerase sigma factor [Mesorhizobium sp. 113-3-9]
MTRDGITKLILRTSKQDRAAFDLLYRHTSSKLFGVCLHILGDRADAEEALQEVFLKVWAKADRFAVSEVSPISWLIAIARNQAIDRIRSRRPPSLEIDQARDVADPSPWPEAHILACDCVRLVHRCIDHLPKEKAEAVRSAYFDGESYAVLAARYNVPLNTMRTWLRRSLIKLRQAVED